ncbi:phosphatidylinositol-specific phospholipase C domain-containing protein [Kitasatospora sp. NPDC101176]|uniref:phosphatidylinositol-specific phospholipase C domain-containing protein n=1 Tax=Kitasatospora sp. NPDC101176 TaxID=3364099 RepID=UPI00381940BA
MFPSHQWHRPAAGTRPPAGTRLGALRAPAVLGLAAALSLAAATAPASAANLPWAPKSSSPWFNSLTSISLPDWMSHLPAGTKLGRMSIPGTHDTLAIHGGLAPWYYETQENHGDSAETLTAQLNAGIRAIDIRVRVVNGGTAFALHHSDVYQNANFDDVLTKARTFLTAHPGETIIMKLAGECGYGSGIGYCTDDPSSTTGADRSRIFQSYLARYPGLFWAPSATGTGTAATPTLGQARGHIVLAQFGNTTTGYGLTGYSSGNIPWTECNLDTKWGYVKARLDQVAADTGNTLNSTGTSSSCPPFGATYVDMANGYRGGKGENQRLQEYLASTTGHAGIVETDWPGARLINSIITHKS